MRKTGERLLVLLVALSLSAAGCSASAKPAPLPTTGTVGATLQAVGAQFTLDQVVPDPTQQLVTAVLTVANTSSALVDLSSLSLKFLLSDVAGHSYSPNNSSAAFVSQCIGQGIFVPLDAGKSAQGCVYFQVPAGAVPSQLELLVQPTLRWRLSSAPPPGTTTPGQGGTGAGTGTGPGTGTGTGTGAVPGAGTGTGPGTGTGTGPGTTTPPNGVGPAKKKHPGHHPRVKKPKVVKVKKVKPVRPVKPKKPG